MTRPTITKTDSNTVALVAIDPVTEERIERIFTVPTNGGYVRDEQGRQVCKRLASRGDTLTATDADDLLRTVRSEWAAYRRSAKREDQRFGW